MSIREIITPDLLKATFIAGVDLTFDDGTPYTDAMFELAIDTAISMIEQDLQINIDPVSISEERHDSRDAERDSYFLMKLDQRPVVSVDNIAIRHGNYQPIDLPAAWTNLILPRHGQVQIIPTSESLGGFMFTQGGYVYPSLLLANYQYFPGYFSVDYTSGFQYDSGEFQLPAGPKGQTLTVSFAEKMLDKAAVYFSVPGLVVQKVTPTSFIVKTTEELLLPLDVEWKSTTCPSALVKAILMIASMLPLDVAGDLIAGAGIAQQRISVDGLSQEINTTSSATNAGYGARILSFQNQLKTLLPALRSQYRTSGVFNL
jgi:hypothetical protein